MQETPGSLFSSSTTIFRRLSNSATIVADRILRAGQRREAGILRRRVDAGPGVDRELAHVVVERLRPHRVAHPPAGHGVGLRPAVEQDQRGRGSPDRRGARRAAGRHRSSARRSRPTGSRRRGCLARPATSCVDLGLGRHAAGRVGGRIEDHQPRLRRDQRERLLGREGEAVLPRGSGSAPGVAPVNSIIER